MFGQGLPPPDVLVVHMHTLGLLWKKNKLMFTLKQFETWTWFQLAKIKSIWQCGFIWTRCFPPKRTLEWINRICFFKILGIPRLQRKPCVHRMIPEEFAVNLCAPSKASGRAQTVWGWGEISSSRPKDSPGHHWLVEIVIYYRKVHMFIGWMKLYFTSKQRLPTMKGSFEILGNQRFEFVSCRCSLWHPLNGLRKQYQGSIKQNSMENILISYFVEVCFSCSHFDGWTIDLSGCPKRGRNFFGRILSASFGGVLPKRSAVFFIFRMRDVVCFGGWCSHPRFRSKLIWRGSHTSFPWQKCSAFKVWKSYAWYHGPSDWTRSNDSGANCVSLAWVSFRFREAWGYSRRPNN